MSRGRLTVGSVKAGRTGKKMESVIAKKQVRTTVTGKTQLRLRHQDNTQDLAENDHWYLYMYICVCVYVLH